jgi:ligand-binding sensor domain-containing protein
MQRQLFFFCFIFSFRSAPAQLQPIGQWREHLSYNQAKNVTATKKGIFCATPYSLFSIDAADNSINRYSKINGLHETGIQNIQWDAGTDKLIIVYNNSNVDILAGNKIFNIDAIKQKDIPGDKQVNNIFCYEGNAYLSSGLGIIVIDENKYEVKDTYIIGNTGDTIRVNGLTADSGFFYAATDEGLKKAPVSSINLADFQNWQLLSGADGLSDGICSNVLTLQNKVVVQKSDSFFVLKGNAWSLLYRDDWKINNATVSGDRLVVCQQKGADARLLVINSSGAIEKTITKSNFLLSPQQAILMQNNVWAADSISGLLEFEGASEHQYQPNSPLSAATGEMTVRNGVLWAASGSVTTGWSNTFTKNGVYQFKNNEWTNFNRSDIAAMDSLDDVITTAIDPGDNSLWAGSFGGGLFQIKADKSIQIFKQNSPLSASLNDINKYLIAGLAFDNENNLWIADYGAAQNLAVKKLDGNWKNFFVPFSLSNNAVSQIVIDNFNQKWIVSPGGNGLVCFNHGQSIDNFGDDKWKLYKAGAGLGNLPDNNVLCIAKDKNSFIWVGTGKGVGIIQCPQQVFTAQGCDAVLPIVQQDNFAGYLFGDEQVQSIAIDGADRKWVGTKNGAWLISPEGDNIIYRFTEDNSPLLNNNVQKIAIDGITGEVFFATDKGICSFRSTATEGEASNKNVLVFPNPVPPGYNGTIAVRGLAENAVVKITELDGRLVYQTRALGGQAVWNGKDYRGRTVSTGVYLVLVSDDSRQQKMVTKIVFISK